MKIFTDNYLLIGAIFFIALSFAACGGPNGNRDNTETKSGDNSTPDIAHYTDAPPEGEMARTLHLLERAKYPFYAVRAKPRPEFTRFDGLKDWNAYMADDYDVRVFVFLYGNQTEALYAMDGLQLSGDEQGLYRRMGVNGALLFMIEMDEEPDMSDEEHWVVSDYLSALAGEE